MKRALTILLLFFLVVLATMLTQLNNELVNFNYYFDTTTISLPILLLLAVVFGALIGLFMTVGMAMSASTDRRRLRQKLKLCEQEIANLRDIPIKGRH